MTIINLIKALIYFTIIVIIIGTLAYGIIDLSFYYLNDELLSYPKIKFKSFKNFYAVNPNRWQLEDNYVICVDYYYSEYYNYYSKKENIKLRFGFLETKLYENWLNTKKKELKNQQDIETISKVISMVKDDINNLEKNAQEQINKGTEIYTRVLKNVKVEIPTSVSHKRDT